MVRVIALTCPYRDWLGCPVSVRDFSLQHRSWNLTGSYFGYFYL